MKLPEKLENLKQGISSQQDFFTKIKNKNKAAAEESFWLAHLLAKQRKPFYQWWVNKIVFDSSAE